MSRRTRNHRAGGEATVGEPVGRMDLVEVDFWLVGIGVSVLVGIGAVRREVAVPRGTRAREHATAGMAQAAAARHEGESAHAGALGYRRLRGGAKISARGGVVVGAGLCENGVVAVEMLHGAGRVARKRQGHAAPRECGAAGARVSAAGRRAGLSLGSPAREGRLQSRA